LLKAKDEFVERFVSEAQAVVTLRTPACDGPVAWKDLEAAEKDINRWSANSRAARL